jgi:hypothetical protein
MSGVGRSGPRGVLSSLAASCWPAGASRPVQVVSLRPGEPESGSVAQALAQLLKQAGASISVDAINKHERVPSSGMRRGGDG